MSKSIPGSGSVGDAGSSADAGVLSGDSGGRPAQPEGRPGWVNWLFADRKTGRIVIGQFPNLPLWIFLAAVLCRLVFRPDGWVGVTVDVVANLALLWWALDEVIRGVNPWRRILGASVTVLLVFGIITGWVI